MLESQEKSINQQLKDIEETIITMQFENSSLQTNINQLNQEFITHLGKLEMSEAQLNEEIKLLEEQVNELQNEEKEFENSINAEAKTMMEEISAIKAKFTEEKERNEQNYNELLSSLEAQLLVIESEKTELNMNIENGRNEEKRLQLDIDIAKRQIQVLEQINKKEALKKPIAPAKVIPKPIAKPARNTNSLPLMPPRKRTFDEYSDSSAEGVAYSTKQMLQIKQAHKK